jgi:hypothetical protein
VKIDALVLPGLVLVMCSYALSVTAMGAGPDRVPITDPAVLESMGLSRDASNVYQLVNAQSRLGGDAQPEGDFGTGAQFTSITPLAFRGRLSTPGSPWHWDSYGGFDLMRAGIEKFADAPLQLPHGARLQFVRVWAEDLDAMNNMVVFLIESCPPAVGAGAMTVTLLLPGGLGGLATSGATGYQSLVATTSAIVDNQCAYMLRVRFDGTFQLRLQHLRVQWLRQISPAPTIAQFTDVPKTAQFFREVEALAASGITSGCTATTFCPESFVTRRQLAAFLARALGL